MPTPIPTPYLHPYPDPYSHPYPHLINARESMPNACV